MGFSDNFMLSRTSLTLDFGRNGSSNFSHQGRGLFGVTMLMWTNAGNAAIFLGLSEQIQKNFCFDIVTSSYEDMDVPIKAGIVVMLLLMVGFQVKIYLKKTYLSIKTCRLTCVTD